MSNIIEREHESIYQTYKRLPIVIESANGCHLTDSEGTVYLDMLGGIAVNALGHSHPRILEAIDKQARKYLHVSNFFYQEPQVLLAEKLCSMSNGYDKVIFSNSGAEAWEGAMKLVRKWGNARGKTGNIIGFTQGFHGRTYGALSTMNKPLYKDGMEPFLPNTCIVEYNNVDALRAVVNETTCAVGLEFIQGEGGCTIATTEFVNALFALKEQFGFAVIADEVQAGIGRTGDFFGFEFYGVQPDIITFAKGIGGGLPLGGLLTTGEFSTVFSQGQHGTTYGGNALACATGLVVLEELEKSVMNNVREVAAYLDEKLLLVQKQFPTLITELRGRGLMRGVVLTFDSTLLRDALVEQCVITSATAGTVLRLVPPLILTLTDVNEFIDKLCIALSSFE